MVSKAELAHTMFIVALLLFESCDNHLRGLLLELIELICYMGFIYLAEFPPKRITDILLRGFS